MQPAKIFKIDKNELFVKFSDANGWSKIKVIDRSTVVFFSFKTRILSIWLAVQKLFCLKIMIALILILFLSEVLVNYFDGIDFRYFEGNIQQWKLNRI